jgi:Flp pilus assembly protein TadG
MAPINLHSRVIEERGAALVEFALTLPLLLVVIAGIVDFGFVFQRQEVITNAVREGARLAVLPGYDATAVESRVRTYVQQGLSLSDGALNAALPPTTGVTVAYNDVDVPLQGGGTASVPTAQVDVNYTHSFVILGPILSLINGSWGSSMTLRATSQMRLEVVAGGGS